MQDEALLSKQMLIIIYVRQILQFEFGVSCLSGRMTQKQPLEVRFVADEDVLDHIVEKQQGKSVSLTFYINNFMRSSFVCFT